MGGQARLLLVLVTAALVAFAVWTWLPPAAATQEDIKQTLVAYETLQHVVWPGEYADRRKLPKDVEERMRHDWADTLAAVADGSAFDQMLDADPLGRAIEQHGKHPDSAIVVDVEGRVVLFDVRRRTLRGELLVRAAVQRWVDWGRWDAAHGELVDVQRHSAQSCPVIDYTLRQSGDAWRVVASSPTDEPPFVPGVPTGESGTGL